MKAQAWTKNKTWLKWGSVHVLFFLVLVILLTWWKIIILDQAKQILDLKIVYQSVDASQIQKDYDQTLWMIQGEYLSFLVFLALATGFLLWMMRRDIQRRVSSQIFFTGLTHEMKTPLASIRLQLEAIRDHVENREKVKKYAERLEKDCNRLEGTHQRLLELAQVESGKEFILEKINFEDAKKMMEEIAGETGLSLEFKFEKAGSFYADRTAFKMIIRNVFENTDHHSGSKKIKINFQSEVSGATLSFQDFGKGSEIDLNLLGKVFQKRKNSHGTGLGLYLIRKMMRDMKGDAEFLSSPQGFIVKVSFYG